MMNQTLEYATYITQTNPVANRTKSPQTYKSKPEVEKFDENWMVCLFATGLVCVIYVAYSKV